MKLIIEVYPDGSTYAYRQTEDINEEAKPNPKCELPLSKLAEECDLDAYRGHHFLVDLGPDEVKTDYQHLRELLFTVMDELSILAGDRIGPSNKTHHDIAETAGANLIALGHCIRATRGEGGIVYPSPNEALDESES